MFMFRCSIIMWSQHVTVTVITYIVWITYFSPLHCSALCLVFRTVCVCCAVSSDSGTAQHSCNVVNWIQKIVFHLTYHGQVEPLTVVIKCRRFTLVEKKCDVAVSTVCLLSLFNESPLPADIIQVQTEDELICCFIEWFIDWVLLHRTYIRDVNYVYLINYPYKSTSIFHKINIITTPIN